MTVEHAAPDLAAVLAAIDAANAASDPADLAYGQRMSAELARFAPGAPDGLRIACRGQHVERALLKRAGFPEGRAGYLAWRRAQAEHHASRVGAIMAAAAYPETAIARVRRMLRKEGIKRDPDVQMLEDVACLTFLRWYAGAFLATRDADGVDRIVALTARKMSPAACADALSEFALPDAIAVHFRAAAETAP